MPNCCSLIVYVDGWCCEMSVDIKVTGITGNARSRVRSIKVRGQYPDAAWRSVGRYMARQVDLQFVTRGVQLGSPWKPLAPSTIRQKRALGYPLQPLVRTGAMKREFLYPAIMRSGKGSEARYGTDDVIAAYQHHGTVRFGKAHIPSRKIIRVTPRVRKDVKRILARYIIDGQV